PRAYELLADHASHRSAHECEVHHREAARLTLDQTAADDHRVAEPGCNLGLGEALRIRAEIEELEHVSGPKVGVALGEGPPIRELLDSLASTNGEVVPTLRTDPESCGKLVVPVMRPASGARIGMGFVRPSRG